MVPDEMIEWMMKRLMASTAQSFDLALARFDAKEREVALAHARTLIESADPDERELGERLKAEIARAASVPYGRMLDVPQSNGDPISPLSLASSASSPGGDTSSNGELGNRSAQPSPPDPSTPGSTSTLNGQPSRRPRGRPRKHPQP